MREASSGTLPACARSTSIALPMRARNVAGALYSATTCLRASSPFFGRTPLPYMSTTRIT